MSANNSFSASFENPSVTYPQDEIYLAWVEKVQEYLHQERSPEKRELDYSFIERKKQKKPFYEESNVSEEEKTLKEVKSIFINDDLEQVPSPPLAESSEFVEEFHKKEDEKKQRKITQEEAEVALFATYFAQNRLPKKFIPNDIQKIISESQKRQKIVTKIEKTIETKSVFGFDGFNLIEQKKVAAIQMSAKNLEKEYFLADMAGRKKMILDYSLIHQGKMFEMLSKSATAGILYGNLLRRMSEMYRSTVMTRKENIFRGKDEKYKMKMAQNMKGKRSGKMRTTSQTYKDWQKRAELYQTYVPIGENGQKNTTEKKRKAKVKKPQKKKNWLIRIIWGSSIGATIIGAFMGNEKKTEETTQAIGYMIERITEIGLV